MIGAGPEEEQVRAATAGPGLTNVTFHTDWIDLLSDLPDTFARADVCLGAFGTTAQAERAISHKVYMALAMGKPVITGDSPIIREILEPGRHALLPLGGDDQAPAEAILTLYHHPQQHQAMGQAGLALFRERFTRQAIGQQLRAILAEGMAARRSRPMMLKIVHHTVYGGVAMRRCVVVDDSPAMRRLVIHSRQV